MEEPVWRSWFLKEKEDELMQKLILNQKWI